MAVLAFEDRGESVSEIDSCRSRISGCEAFAQDSVVATTGAWDNWGTGLYSKERRRQMAATRALHDYLTTGPEAEDRPP